MEVPYATLYAACVASQVTLDGTVLESLSAATVGGVAMSLSSAHREGYLIVDFGGFDSSACLKLEKYCIANDLPAT